MKRQMIIPLILLLLLTACHAAPASTEEPTGSTPSSSSVTPPSSSVAPPASSVPPTTPPPAIGDGLAFINKGSGFYVLPNWSFNDGIRGYLYWVVKDTKECTPICEEPVTACVQTDTHVYFIKESEPTRFYEAPIGDFKNHRLLSSIPLAFIKEGMAYIYQGSEQSVLYPPYWRPTEGLEDHLYWVVEVTKECTLICDEPVTGYTRTDTHVYFVKESEPTKVYATPIGDFKNHELFYESTYGKITWMKVETGLHGYMQFVADNKKFVLWDMATGESTLLMEQCYIHYARLYRADDGITWGDFIEFEGKHKESDPLYTQYIYNRITGETEIEPGDDCDCEECV